MGWLDKCKFAAAPVARLESLPCFVLAPRSSLSFSRDDFQTFFGECRSDGGKRQSGRKASPNTYAQGCRKNRLVFSNAECFVAKRANEKEKKLSSLSLSTSDKGKPRQLRRQRLLVLSQSARARRHPGVRRGVVASRGGPEQGAAAARGLGGALAAAASLRLPL